jgi:hypothetical protein
MLSCKKRGRRTNAQAPPGQSNQPWSGTRLRLRESVIRRPFDSADLGMREYTKKKQQQSEQLILLGLFVELAKRRR